MSPSVTPDPLSTLTLENQTGLQLPSALGGPLLGAAHGITARSHGKSRQAPMPGNVARARGAVNSNLVFSLSWRLVAPPSRRLRLRRPASARAGRMPRTTAGKRPALQRDDAAESDKAALRQRLGAGILDNLNLGFSHL